MAIFIAVFLFLRPILPLGEYVLDYNHIAKELCVNKDEPTMHCNGKCHLMKELAKKAAEETPSSDKKTATRQFEFPAILQQPFTIAFTPVIDYTSNPATLYNNLYSHRYTPVFLRPPGMV